MFLLTSGMLIWWITSEIDWAISNDDRFDALIISEYGELLKSEELRLVGTLETERRFWGSLNGLDVILEVIYFDGELGRSTGTTLIISFPETLYLECEFSLSTPSEKTLETSDREVYPKLFDQSHKLKFAMKPQRLAEALTPDIKRYMIQFLVHFQGELTLNDKRFIWRSPDNEFGGQGNKIVRDFTDLAGLVYEQRK